MPAPALHPLLISAPFGNYIQPAGTTPTLGTFTAARRRGRLWRIVKTLRRDRKRGAWVNKIGLRNPGIEWLASRVQRRKINLADKLLSIHGFTPDDWTLLLQRVAELKPLGVELNMSCPNVGEVSRPDRLFADALATGVPVVVKIPPVRYEAMAHAAWDAGVRSFHCCNTIPVEKGGMSGKPLMPMSLDCIRTLRADFGSDALLLGGGGITVPADLDAYADAGADHFALGTVTMNPMLLVSHRGLQPLIERASTLVATAPPALLPSADAPPA